MTLGFETNRWIMVLQPYPVFVVSNLWILMDQEIV